MSRVVSVALAAYRQAHREAAKDAEKARGLDAEAAGIEAEAKALAREVAERAADAVLLDNELDGTQVEAAEEDIVKRHRRAQAKRDSSARLRGEAAALHAGKIADAEGARDAAALATFRADRDTAVERLRAGFDKLIPDLAALVASNTVRTALIGSETFVFDSALHPPAELWSGRQVAEQFMDRLPARLLPENFRERVMAGSVRLTAESMAEIEAEGNK